MSGKKKLRGKQFLCGLLAITLVAGNSLVPGSNVKAEETKKVRSQVSYENEKNAVSDDVYEEFGIATNSPAAFDPTDESNPIGDYEPVDISELYVGDMNRDKNWVGSFRVMEDVKKINSSSLNFDNMGQNLIGNEHSFAHINKEGKDPVEVQTHNACAVDGDGDGVDDIVDVTLFVSRDYDEQSYAVVALYGLEEKEKDGVKTEEWDCTTIMQSYQLSDDNSDEKNFVWSIEADISKSFTSMAAGDYDGDNKEEVAVYIPSKIEDKAFVVVFDIDEKKGLVEKGKINLSKLNNGSNQFNYDYESTCLPVVHLATTSISGQDDLVINVSHPLDDDGDTNKYGHDSAFGIYHWDQGSFVERYAQKSMVFGNYRMRFCSAADTDLNGNGIGELAIAGYKNIDWSDNEDVGELSDTENCVMLMCWNDVDKKYEMVWDAPQMVPAFDDLTVDKSNMEPVALASGALHTGKTEEQLFLEGVLFDYDKFAAEGATEKDLMKPGVFTKILDIEQEGSNDPFISTAVAATFSKTVGTKEQMVILMGDHKKADNDQVYYDILWIWEENGKLKSEVTNNDYMDDCDEDDNGTFISICEINADDDTVYMKYAGKTYGWSAPELYCVLQSIPYWEEIPYSLNYAGSTSFAMTYGTSEGETSNWGLGIGYHIGASLELGAGILSNSALIGGGFDLAAMAKYLNSFTEEHSAQDTFQSVVYPGKDYVVVFAVPVVDYIYKVWVPEYEITEDYIKKYKEITGKECEHPVGYKMEASEQEMTVRNTMEPSLNCMEMDKYNALANKYPDLELKSIEKDMLASKTMGDPTTYPQNVDDLEHPNNIVEGSLHTSPVAQVTSGNSETNLNYSIGTSESTSTGYNVSLDGEAFGKGSAEVQLFIAWQAGAQWGWRASGEKGHATVTSSSSGMSFASMLKNAPEGTPDAYDYSAQMAVFQIDDASEGKEEYPYVIGFIVGSNTSKIPPKVPQNLHVFAAGKNRAVLKWDKSDYRGAESYEVFVKDNHGDEISIGKTSDSYYIIDSLDEGAEYEFAVKSYATGGNGEKIKSVMSHWVTLQTTTTKKAMPYFVEQPRNDVISATHIPQLTCEAAAAIEGAKINYQWQELEENGEWSNIEGATENYYDVSPDIKETEYYRVKATQIAGGNALSVYSKTAAIFTSKEEAVAVYDTNISIAAAQTGTAEEWNPDVMKWDDNFYTGEDLEKQEFIIHVENATNPEIHVNGGNVDMFLVDEKGNVRCESAKVIDGSAYVIFRDGVAAGNYKVYAEYYGARDGKFYFMPSRSTDLDLHAIRKYQMNYHLNGGYNHPQNPTVVSCEQSKVVLGRAEKVGYQATGWYWDEACSEKVSDETIDTNTLRERLGNSKEIHLYAGYEVMEYNISYHLNGGVNAETNPDTYTVEDTPVKFADPIREGYLFKGWFLDEAGTEKVTQIGQNETGDKELYALWEKVVDNEEPEDSKPDDSKPDDGKPDDDKPDSNKPNDDKSDNGKDDSEKDNSNVADTGDHSNMTLMVLLLGASFMMICVVLAMKNKAFKERR